MGTPLYMSPEQCRGEQLDARSDVYSLAAVAYEMIVGKTPFRGNNVVDICSQHQSDRPPLFSFDLRVPSRVEMVVQKGLEKNRDKRHADAAEFSRELQKAFRASNTVRTQTARADPAEATDTTIVNPEPSAIQDLTENDTLTLKLSCEIGIEKGYLGQIQVANVLEKAAQKGASQNDILESLEFLGERGYFDLRRVMGGGLPFQSYAISTFGFHEYAKVFIAEYVSNIDDVIVQIVSYSREDNLSIAQELLLPIVMINHILDLLESNNWITRSKRLGGKVVISKVTAELKRKARQIERRRANRSNHD